MKIQCVEIQNFRKLKSVRIDFNEGTTLFVGANNSGKTSAMDALGCFLVSDKRFTINEFTLSNQVEINKIGEKLVSEIEKKSPSTPTIADWDPILPTMDVWLQVENDEVHYVSDLLPSLKWPGGILGVRLRYEPNSIDEFNGEFLEAYVAANEIREKAQGQTLSVWPKSMSDFLAKKLTGIFSVRAYSLNADHLKKPVNGRAVPQALPIHAMEIPFNSFFGIIQVDVINAQRGFGKSGSDSPVNENRREHSRRLSDQLKSYYVKHLDPQNSPDISDIDALQAISVAEKEFDNRLESGFAEALRQVESVGYPGVANPSLNISTRIRPMDGLDHDAAVQYKIFTESESGDKNTMLLPEDYNGLGYLNLISMVFRLMSFRDGWLQIGKATKKDYRNENLGPKIPPLHLVLIEEPEAHLHAQVQQVFIRQAYKILRDHKNLGESRQLSTQLVVSTHSSHIAHECNFECLRYFRRMPALQKNMVPISSVVNLSEVFSNREKVPIAENNVSADTESVIETQKFVTRYLKAVHCDLFFADAAILVEGTAERMMIPHFIRNEFQRLNESYITILEIGGSHAYRLRPLIEHLGLTTLVITDLDSAKPNEKSGKNSACAPKRGNGQVTTNTTLKKWHPEREKIDDLLDFIEDDKVKLGVESSAIRVAFQTAIEVNLDGNEDVPSQVLSSTFEDALVLANYAIFKKLKGDGLIGGFQCAIINNSKSGSNNSKSENLTEELFNLIRGGNKGKFALELLYLDEADKIKAPLYIEKGLNWLEAQLTQKRNEFSGVGRGAIETESEGVQ